MSILRPYSALLVAIHRALDARLIAPAQWGAHRVRVLKPGVTGWGQVNGWHGDDTLEKMQRRVEHDLDYMQNWSLWLDLKIVVAPRV